MSAFLGPIHYWLYNKIQQQQAIVDEIYQLGNQYNLNLQKDCEARYGTFENKPLEEMIDHGNIHGWLQERVSQVEYKYAYSVTSLIDKDPNSMDKLKSILFDKGKELGQSLQGQHLNAPLVFKIISDNLLDGMPCDHANSLVDQSEEQVVWKRNLCVHENYWVENEGDIKVYYELRDAWMNGLTKAIGFVFDKLDSTTYSIKKEV
ncbi:hypothetical protein I5677_14730 [Mobilitalea sibirica]|uniref:Uncharacterized protein n=1 Tax=Mobilitalea sibirica TaxID=1462919 RepID=A0A8J7HC96_9FIRM|nr:hypothetical protein [Mobilitalea sibirica]MBH1942155.1 hypothetical protein [Mobilitalea sibirica]